MMILKIDLQKHQHGKEYNQKLKIHSKLKFSTTKVINVVAKPSIETTKMRPLILFNLLVIHYINYLTSSISTPITLDKFYYVKKENN
jgi:hypothetical protein